MLVNWYWIIVPSGDACVNSGLCDDVFCAWSSWTTRSASICHWRTRKKTKRILCPFQSCWNWSWRSCFPSSSFRGQRRSSCSSRPWRRERQARCDDRKKKMQVIACNCFTAADISRLEPEETQSDLRRNSETRRRSSSFSREVFECRAIRKRKNKN